MDKTVQSNKLKKKTSMAKLESGTRKNIVQMIGLARVTEPGVNFIKQCTPYT